MLIAAVGYHTQSTTLQSECGDTCLRTAQCCLLCSGVVDQKLLCSGLLHQCKTDNIAQCVTVYYRIVYFPCSRVLLGPAFPPTLLGWV
jgi:hypothetical protein